MNRFFLNIFFFFLLPTLIGQQNLVPNGSFEEYSECPTLNELNNGQFERAIGWFRPTFGTSDYYHRCNNNGNGIVGVPNNFWGHQEPYHGDGYIGFGAICWEENGENLGNEYVRCRLNTVLKPCVRYHFSMYISLSDKSTHGVGKIGVLFSNDNEFIATDLFIDKYPQFFNNGLPIIDSSNWFKVEGEFIASGLEQYITIGYYSNTANSDTLFIQNNGLYQCSYYYVDSVSLIETGPVSEEICDAGDISFPNIITPNSDNSNDVLDASPYFVITDEIVILNRWGNIVTILTEEEPTWDGRTTNDKPCTDGVYFYKFSYQWGDELKQKSGFIHLVR